VSSTPTVNRFPLPWVNPKSVLVLAIATALGIVVAIYPLLIFAGFVICLALYSIWSWTRGRINLWQTITLATLTSYLVLNYGFDNFTVLHVPAGELLMLLALALAIGQMKRGFLKKVLSDPPVTCLIVLLLLSCCHLLFDVPRYGFYAVRDGSMMFEAVFLILGVAWTETPRHIDILTSGFLLPSWRIYSIAVPFFGPTESRLRLLVSACSTPFRCSEVTSKALCGCSSAHFSVSS